MGTMKFLPAFVFILLTTAISLTNGCSTLTEGFESVVDCSNASDISEVVAYMDELFAANSLVHDTFRIRDNLNVDNLIDDLFGNIQFTSVEISGCSALNQVGDFLGASRTTINNFRFEYNGYLGVPALNAENLKSIYVGAGGSNALQLTQSTFAKMRNIEIASFMNAEVHPLAFYDLKNLRQLYLPFQPQSFQNLTAGTLLFASNVLEFVDLPHTVFSHIEYGSIEGFPTGSELRLYADWSMTKEAFYNLLSGGGRLFFWKRTGCGCEIAWIRLGPFLDQTFIACARPGGDVLLQNIPEEEFANCEVN